MTSAPPIIQPKDMTSDKLKMLVYGSNSVGKTFLVTTAPKPIYLALEKSPLTMRRYNIPTMDINSWSELQAVFEYLKLAKHDFQTVMFDSLNEAQFLSQKHVLEAKGHESMQQGDWGDSIWDIQNLCRAFTRHLDMNVIFTCALDHLSKVAQPDIATKRLPGDLLNLFDFVGYMVAKEEKSKITRAIRFEPSELIRAKNRDGVFDLWEKPDFAALVTKLKTSFKKGVAA